MRIHVLMLKNYFNIEYSNQQRPDWGGSHELISNSFSLGDKKKLYKLLLILSRTFFKVFLHTIKAFLTYNSVLKVGSGR